MLPYSGTFAKLGENITHRHRAADRREGRQARRPRHPDRQARRRIQARAGPAERRPPRQARPGRRADRHRALGRADGHPQGGVRERHAHHRAERRQRRRDARPVRQERVPLLLHQLAAGLRHGRRRGQEGLQEERVGDLGLRGRRRERRGLQGGVREGRRPSPAQPLAAVPADQLPAAAGADSRASASMWSGLVLRRRRCGPVRQGVCGRRPQGAAVRLGLPDRGHARARRAPQPRASRRRCTTATDSTTRRTPRSARPSRTRPAATPTSMPCRATTPRSCWRSGLEAVKGKIEDEANLYKALRAAKIDSPRGPISMSPAQNVTQNIYLRKARGRPEQGDRHRRREPRRPRHRLQAGLMSLALSPLAGRGSG